MAPGVHRKTRDALGRRHREAPRPPPGRRCRGGPPSRRTRAPRGRRSSRARRDPSRAPPSRGSRGPVPRRLRAHPHGDRQRLGHGGRGVGPAHDTVGRIAHDGLVRQEATLEGTALLIEVEMRPWVRWVAPGAPGRATEVLARLAREPVAGTGLPSASSGLVGARDARPGSSQVRDRREGGCTPPS